MSSPYTSTETKVYIFFRKPYKMNHFNLGLAGMEGMMYRRNELALQPGDAIFLYTDGATEATNAAGELYGENRPLGLLDGCPDAPASEICKIVMADLAVFAGDHLRRMISPCSASRGRGRNRAA